MNKKSVPKASGFALVISLTLMAMIVLLLVSLSTTLQVELSSSTHRKNQELARENAIFGMQVALGNLQILAGPDQRVTAPATAVYPNEQTEPTMLSMFKEFSEPTFGFETFLTHTQQEGYDTRLKDWWETRNPHWMSIWDSTRTDGVPERDQLPVWLVSGNENFDLTDLTEYPAEYLTPDKEQDTLDGIYGEGRFVYLVDEGSAVIREDSSDGYDGRVRALKQPITDADSLQSGNYAYWVGDESMKANFALRDPYYDVEDIKSREYRNRLQSPQRVGWENITGFDIVGETDGPSPNDPRLEMLTSSDQIELLDETGTLIEPVRKNFHSLTAYSKSLLTDVVNGGFKKDLTVYFEKGAGATKGQIVDDNPIPDPDGSDFFEYASDTRLGSSAGAGFPASYENIPTWEELKDWYEKTGSETEAVSVGEEFAPVVTYVRMFYGFSYSGGNVRMHLLPVVVLWNPYDAPLASARYELSIEWPIELVRFQVASDATSVALTSTSYDEDGTDGKGFPDGEYVSPVYYDTDTADPNIVHNVLGVYHMAGMKHGDTNAPPTDNPTPEWLVHQMTPLNGITATENRGDFSQPWYEFRPWDKDGKITLEFEVGFEAGENLIMSVEDDVNATHSMPEIRLPVANVFWADQPASASFDIMSLDRAPIDDSNMIFIGTFGSAPSSYGVTLTTFTDEGPIDTYTTDQFGYDFGRGNAANLTYGIDWDHTKGNASKNYWNIQDTPSMWRPLYGSNLGDGGDFRDMSGSSTEGAIGKNEFGSNEKASPLVLYMEAFLAPFGTVQSGIDAGDYDHQKYINKFWRGMAVHNLNARNLNVHPLIDEHRVDLAQNNPDKFPRKILGVGRSSVGGVIDYSNGRINMRPGAYNWETPIADSSSSNARGSSLVTPFYPTAADDLNAGAPLMPVRHIKRADSDLVSLGQLQQVNLSDFLWQPAFPIGNSEASPYVDRELMAGIESRDMFIGTEGKNDTFGTVPNNTENHGIDLSYLLNDALWDRYFLSTIPQDGELEITSIPEWPNSRHRPKDLSVNQADLRDFDTAAENIYNEGALNVNSTSVEAWKALLTAFRDLEIESAGAIHAKEKNPEETAPIARTLDPLEGPIDFTFDPTLNQLTDYGAVAANRDYYRLVSGFRYLTDEMIETLAERIVDEVRLRGPFLSMADFVNRRLVAPDKTGGAWDDARATNSGSTDNFGRISSAYDPMVGISGINGALQRAINLSGINGGMNYPTDTSGALLPGYNLDGAFGVWPSFPGWGKTDDHFNMYAGHNHYLDREHEAGVPAGEFGQLMSHLPGFVTQGDLLSMIGPALTVRGDTFIIRSYGDHINTLTGEVDAKAWLEVIVQRTHDEHSENNRKFQIISMRWLNEEDV